MQADAIKALIMSGLESAQVQVVGDGRHFEAIIISNEFEGLASLARQRKIHTLVGEHLRNGTIHALSIKTKTPQEWANENQ